MAYEVYDPWQRFRDHLCWAVVIFGGLSFVPLYFAFGLKTVITSAVCLIAIVLAIFSWRAPTKQESAWFVFAAFIVMVIAGFCFVYVPLGLFN